MKTKTRLFLFNLIIVLTSVLLIFCISIFIEQRSRRTIRDIETVVNGEFSDANSHLPPLEASEKPEIRAPLRSFFTELTIIILVAIAIIIALAIFLSNFFLRRSLEQQQAIYDSARRSMLNGISHDIRTPLTVIKGNIKGIEDGVANSPAKRQQYLATAYTRTEDIEQMLNQFFENFNYATGNVALQPVNTDLTKFLPDLIDHHEAVSNGLLAVNYDFPEAAVYAKIDKVQFKRVFDNLINNSVKHNPRQRNLTLNVTLKRGLTLIIADNGKGVQAASLPHLFDEFYKEDGSRSQDKQSSGLGLAIVRQIIEAHGGSISAKNHHGLEFIIKLKEAK